MPGHYNRRGTRRSAAERALTGKNKPLKTRIAAARALGVGGVARALTRGGSRRKVDVGTTASRIRQRGELIRGLVKTKNSPGFHITVPKRDGPYGSPANSPSYPRGVARHNGAKHAGKPTFRAFNSR